MSADLTCPACNGNPAVMVADIREWMAAQCSACNGTGRRRPELHEWDALKAERDRYRAILAGLLECGLCRRWGDTSPCGHWDWAFARAALDGGHTDE